MLKALECKEEDFTGDLEIEMIHHYFGEITAIYKERLSRWIFKKNIMVDKYDKTIKHESLDTFNKACLLHH